MDQEFSIGDFVKMKPNDYKGKVVGIDRTNGIPFYNVEYSDKEGVLKRMFFQAHELEERKPTKAEAKGE